MQNQKGFVKILLIVIAVIIVAGFFYVRMSLKKVEAPSNVADFTASDFGNVSSIAVVGVKNEIADWKTYRNEEYGFEIKYPADIFQLDKNTNTLSHALKNFRQYSQKDGSDLGSAKDIKIVFNKNGCNFLEKNLQSTGKSFGFKNINGINYETGAEGEGVIYYCVKDEKDKNIFLIERWFLKESYSLKLPEQKDYISSKEQEKIFNQILSTFKFVN